MTEKIGVKHEIVFSPLRWYGSRFYALIFGLLAVVGWGVYAYYVQLTTGLGVTGMRNETVWGFYVINFVFLIGISHAGTLISAILRVANADWRRPITRMAESITVMSIVIAALFPLIDLGRPDRLINIFALARFQSPLVWDFLCIGTYLAGSIVYLYLPLIPDIAQCRDSISEASRLRRWLYQTLSLGWSGTKEQEEKLKRAIKVMAVLIIPIAVSVHSIVSWDFAMTLRVEWHSTVFAPYFVGGAIFSGIATIIIVMAVFRKFFHLERYIEHKHFVKLALMMFALDIAMIYFTISKDLVAGYGAETLDVIYLTSLFTGPYAPFFWFQIIGGMVIPAVLIAVPRTRRSLAWLVGAAVLVDAGMWVERYLLITPALAVPQLPYPVGVYVPSWIEISIVAAGLAGFALLLAIFGRVFPVVSLWEVSEGETASIPTGLAAPAPISPSGMGTVGRSSSHNTTRREFLSFATLAGAGLAFGLAAPRLASGKAGVQNKANTYSGAASGSALPLSNLGRATTLEGAKRIASFDVTTPTRLPPGSAIKDVRVAEVGERIALLYDSAQLEPLSIYSERVAIAIFQTPDRIIASAPAYLPAGFVRVDVGGSEGFAREPSSADSGRLEPGQIQWWRNDIRYSIFANMSIQDLNEIAASRWV